MSVRRLSFSLQEASKQTHVCVHNISGQIGILHAFVVPRSTLARLLNLLFVTSMPGKRVIGQDAILLVGTPMLLPTVATVKCPFFVAVRKESLKRFVDEGVDMRNYTYAKFGRAIHEQPASVAYQVWDQRTIPWLRDEEYRDERVQKVWGATLEELAKNLAKDSGLNAPDQFVETVKQYNEAVYASQIENPDRKWDPAIKDGLTTQSSEKKLVLAKSNWALPKYAVVSPLPLVDWP